MFQSLKKANPADHGFSPTTKHGRCRVDFWSEASLVPLFSCIEYHDTKVAAPPVFLVLAEGSGERPVIVFVCIR